MLPEDTAAWSAVVVLSVLTDLLFGPVASSLDVGLKEINRNRNVGEPSHRLDSPILHRGPAAPIPASDLP